MGVIRVPLIGGPWDGSHANVPSGAVPPDPYRVEVRSSNCMHFYKLNKHERDGKTIFEYNYDRVEKMQNDRP